MHVPLQQHLFFLLHNRCNLQIPKTPRSYPCPHHHQWIPPQKLSSQVISTLHGPQQFPNLPPAVRSNAEPELRALERNHPRPSDQLEPPMLFNDMERRSSPPPDEHMYTFVVNASAKGGLLGEGMQVHGKVLKSVFCSNVLAQSSLVDFYVKNGGGDGVVEAKKVFDEMSDRSIVPWNSLLLGSFRCGDVDGARATFEDMPERNVVSWTTMIAGCAKNGRSKGSGFIRMFSSIYTYCKKPILVTSKNSLIHRYASCGEIDAAFAVFKGMEQKMAVSWTSMITAFAKHGYGNEALSVFQWMQSASSDHARPDEITFLGVLCACSHAGYINEGRHYSSLGSSILGAWLIC